MTSFTGPPVPITARMHSTPQRPFPFSHPVSSSPLSPTSLPFGPANITRKSVYLVLLYTLLIVFPEGEGAEAAQGGVHESGGGEEGAAQGGEGGQSGQADQQGGGGRQHRGTVTK